MELTCPWDSAESFNNAQERKSDRYGPLIGDLSDIGWEVDFITVEIGVRGIIAPGTVKLMCNSLGKSKKSIIKKYLAKCTKLALMCSYTIYNLRDDADTCLTHIVDI